MERSGSPNRSRESRGTVEHGMTSHANILMHMMTRREVVAFFVDMDRTIQLNDHVPPYPPMNSQEDDIPLSNVSTGSCSPLMTRFDTIMKAVRSFLVQKEYSSPSTPNSLLFAVYVVTDSVTQVLDLTSGDISRFCEQLPRMLEKAVQEMNCDRTLPGTTGLAGTIFPYGSVSDELKRISDKLVDQLRTSSMTNKSKSCSSISRAFEGGPSGNHVVTVQGIVFLNRDCAAPKPRGPPMADIFGGEDLSTVCENDNVRRFIDIIPLGKILNDPSTTALHKKNSNRSLDDLFCSLPQPDHRSPPRKPTAATSALEVDCPFSVIDLKEFTGIERPGLAVGVALTKLLMPLSHRNGGRWLTSAPKRIRVPQLKRITAPENERA
ncbi:hypothetical protein TRVL_01771 [Trypanosoma vivax]|uniref:Uncharacterized protein n=1 Tax=Trypanosoma vivax (strain Y486) TaxID=1055687 RepID=G0U0K3_TRYVY|nr:hypothetical protein TRVL_01771 [Trypanosoma vivax]CCC49602.1 conserved hypothetical protein [Trypanosoma vivax Y486]